MTITYSVRPYWGETEPMHSWLHIEDGQIVSELWADLTTGQIMQVETIEARRGEGLAAELYQVASGQVELFHSPEEHRTEAGHGFALAVGGETIDTDLAYTPAA